MVEKVYALGGSVFTENLDKLEDYRKAFDTEEQKVIITGAGNLKKNIIAAEEIGNQAELDLIGIKATRLNAQTLSVALDSYPEIPETVNELRKAADTGKDVVMGGLVPGYSTDAVAATVAELLEADLVIATSVDGVYSKDPELDNAEKFEEVSIQKLKELTEGNNSAGKHDLIDSTALDIIGRSNIQTRVVLGTPENLKSSDFNGTEIAPE